MTVNYTTPLAKWARILEIIIPAYMFGKSWGVANEKTVDLFRAQFPSFLIDTVEYLKAMVETDSAPLQRCIATYAGAFLGILVVAVLAIAIHFILGDRKFIDSLRFTSLTLIPIAMLNGMLSHVVKTILENVDAASATSEALEKAVVDTSWNYFYLNFIFYVIALLIMCRRTEVQRSRRWGVLAVGGCFVAVYIGCGLMIMPAEWAELQPKLMKALNH
jgi:cytochrome bd-type quinol oxidase subunit 2